MAAEGEASSWAEACCPTDRRPARRMGLAFALACPGCAGGFVLAVGTALGAGAAALKGGLLVAGVGILGVLWVRNAWRRRGETG